jgi:transcriptional regulator GlxA family with amidase domain
MFPDSKIDMPENKTTTIGFLLFPGFPMACLTSMIEPLRAANEISGTRVFRWLLVAEHAERIMSSAEVGFDAPVALAECDNPDLLFLLSAPTGVFRDPRAGAAILRKLARHGTVLGAISGGVFPLVRTGLMAERTVSVHWCYETAFRAAFPDIHASDDVIVMDRARYTVSGAAAAFDLALRLVQDRLGADIAHEVACWFQHPLMRGQGVRQQLPTAESAVGGDGLPELVSRCVTLFAGRMQDPVSIAEVAQLNGVTPRQIERAFKRATGLSPTHFYRSMRMKLARQMVVYSKNSMADISAAVGYGSAATMVAHYRQAHGLTPSADRQRANAFRVEGNAPIPSM